MKCGGCTLCCDLFPVAWLEKPANTKCLYCDNGCMIHNEKPPECSNFDCAYAQGKGVDIKFRPDKCGIIFEKLSDKLFFGTVKDVAGKQGVRQSQSFVHQGFSVVLASPKKLRPLFLINENHSESEIRKEFANHLTSRYGSIRH